MQIVVLGGGTAGWMVAAALRRALAVTEYRIQLVESEDIGTVGVGEATLPHIRDFNAFLGLDEAEFMRATGATFKLGIRFRDWGAVGGDYYHPFGVHGRSIAGVPLYQYWLRAQRAGTAFDLEDFSFPIVASRRNRFALPSRVNETFASGYSYAYHFDAGLYAAHLRRWAEKKGVERIEGRVSDVAVDPDTGAVTSLLLNDGRNISGNLFIDCSGFRALLISGALKTEWEDWSKWLPCDRAIAVPSSAGSPLTPYTLATAREAGWTWRIPLQHRTGNGYVFSSSFTTERRATEVLMNALDGSPEASHRILSFSAGRRRKSWAKNCIAIGLASGFLEPLESTSIYLVQVAINNLIRLFPRGDDHSVLSQEFNRLMDVEYDRVRDFLILHYHANSRSSEEDPTGFWRFVRSTEVPASFMERLEIFRHRGYIEQYKDGLFAPPSWLAVFMGQDIVPEAFDAQAYTLSLSDVTSRLTALRAEISGGVDALPDHADFLRDFCHPERSEALAI